MSESIGTSLSIPTEFDQLTRKRKSGWVDKEEEDSAKKQTEVYRLFACRVYVFDLPEDTTDMQIREAFNTVGSVARIDRDLKAPTVCFIEYANPAQASLAVQKMNKYEFNGKACSVVRSDKAPQKANSEMEAKQKVMKMLETPELRAIKNVPGIVDLLIKKPELAAVLAQHAAYAEGSVDRVASDHRRKLYVGGVYLDVTAEQLRSVFEAYGTIISCTLAPNPDQPGKHRGFGFIEYATEKGAEEATKHMDGFEFCGQRLKIGRTNAASSAPVTNISSEIAFTGMPLTVESLQAQAKMMALPAMGPSNTSSVIVLSNLIDAIDLDDEFETEVKDEMIQFGEVKTVYIHFDQLSLIPGESIRSFVHFASADSAVKARKALHNSWFAGRMVRCEFFNEDRFLKREI